MLLEPNKSAEELTIGFNEVLQCEPLYDNLVPNIFIELPHHADLPKAGFEKFFNQGHLWKKSTQGNDAIFFAIPLAKYADNLFIANVI